MTSIKESPAAVDPLGPLKDPSNDISKKQVGLDGLAGKSSKSNGSNNNNNSKNFNRSLRESTRSYSAAVAAGGSGTNDKLKVNTKNMTKMEEGDKQQEDKESKPTPQQSPKQGDNPIASTFPLSHHSNSDSNNDISERLSKLSVLDSDRHGIHGTSGDEDLHEKKKIDAGEKRKNFKTFGLEGTDGQSEKVEKEVKRSEPRMPQVDLLKLTQDKDQQAEIEKLATKNVALPTRMISLPHLDVSKKSSPSSRSTSGETVPTLNGMHPSSLTTNGTTVGTSGTTATTTGSSGRSRSRKKSREGRRGSASRGRPAGRDKGFLPDHYKTEICRTHRLLGYCEYSENCQFAHGIEELRPRRYGVKYKTQLCKNYHLDGHCRFGSRCKFIHDEQRIQVGDREFWLISPSENLVRVEVVENSQRATQLKALIEAENNIDLSGLPPTEPTNPTSGTPPPTTTTMTTIPAVDIATPLLGHTSPSGINPLEIPVRGSPLVQQQQQPQQQPGTQSQPTISSSHVPISPQSPNLQLPETPFYTSTGYFQPATATSPSTGFPPAPSSGPTSTMTSPIPNIPSSPGFLYSSVAGMSGMSSPGSGSVPHTPVGYYGLNGFGNFSPQMTYGTLDYIQMAGLDPSTPSMMSPLSTASPSPSSTPLHMSPIVPLTRTLHQTFSLRRASSQPQSQQASPAAMLRGRTLAPMPPLPN